MLLKDQPTLKEVAKVFIVGLALRSYLTDGDGQQGQQGQEGQPQQQRRTCFGHELSRRICMLATSSNQRPSSRPASSLSSGWSWSSSWSSSRHRFLKFMAPERLKDYDMQNKQRKQVGQQATQNIEHATECATKSGNNNSNNNNNNNINIINNIENGGGDAQVATLKHN